MNLPERFKPEAGISNDVIALTSEGETCLAYYGFTENTKHYQGNCKWCWKKADNKLDYLASINPEIFDFPERMERKHKFTCTPDRTIPKDGAKIFRDNRTVKDIRAASKFATEPIDEARIYDVNVDMLGFDSLDDDLGACGSGSCEAF